MKAFKDLNRAEVARYLRKVAARIELGDSDGRVMDTNGNTIGNFDLCAAQGKAHVAVTLATDNADFQEGEGC
jgi:hypothetical protein